MEGMPCSKTTAKPQQQQQQQDRHHQLQPRFKGTKQEQAG
jgi:hypothetical protein